MKALEDPLSTEIPDSSDIFEIGATVKDFKGAVVLILNTSPFTCFTCTESGSWRTLPYCMFCLENVHYHKPHWGLTPPAAAVPDVFLPGQINTASGNCMQLLIWNMLSLSNTQRTPEAGDKDLDHLSSKRAIRWSTIKITCR